MYIYIYCYTNGRHIHVGILLRKIYLNIQRILPYFLKFSTIWNFFIKISTLSYSWIYHSYAMVSVFLVSRKVMYWNVIYRDMKWYIVISVSVSTKIMYQDEMYQTLTDVYKTRMRCIGTLNDVSETEMQCTETLSDVSKIKTRCINMLSDIFEILKF